ncbi:meiosis 1 arrest protein [Tachysurus fulvidraco]|uniref:meiosis 1 arrest protein n=1 Tax=Tachysurus fulvidraco TaxID=1234273 RepID=UPI001FEE5EDC|nr:meiosis 1 arrest protein [Tachysurus fulvidraco]XP_026998544.2 meiosis 1 arrest protein [Tachysurus fulvidraco]XP_026998545.2 meiosis 1 arrest protein [Tachysurus fulvidraco]XP_047674992.1 meiosis 1 arrest protein [Tachysurus fulvidraco]XP_047675013.1 meiosis 1 arrest protein [Tachysurus fulvidraco]
MSGRNRTGASASQLCHASSFSAQPPRVLIVDTSPPWWSETRSVLCEALENFLTLASSMEGPCRVPLLSLYAVNLQQECLLPFVQVKGNLVRLHSCVEELRSLPTEGCIQPHVELLKQSVLDSLQQYKQFICHANPGNSVYSRSIDVTVVSSEPGQAVLRQMERGLKDCDLVSLRRLVVVHITVEQNLSDREPTWSPESCSAEGMEHPDDDIMLGAEMDLQLVENSVIAVENILKAWLHDQTGDREHLQLLLPASVHANSPKPIPAHRPEAVCIKCDMQETLVSPALLPFTPDLGAKTENIRDFPPASQSQSNHNSGPQRLRVIKALRAEGVCQSVLYGLPLVIRPTTCWQLDWEEMESNHQTFHALCHTLRSRDWFLLVRTETEFRSASSVFSYYVLQSSASLALLLKPVLTRELMLPCNLPSVNEDPPLSTLNMVERCLEQLETDPVFNPLCLSCNLYPYLRMRGLLSRTFSSRSQSQTRGQRRDTNRPAEGSTPRQLQQGRVRAMVAPLASATPAKMSRPPLTLSHSRPSLCFVDDDVDYDLLMTM